MESFICENPECGKAITKFVGIPCAIVPKHIHQYCLECGINAECICTLQTMQEIYDLLYPWVSKRCPRCRNVFSDQDSVDFDEEDRRWYHQICVDEGRRQMEQAKKIQEELAAEIAR